MLQKLRRDTRKAAAETGHRSSEEGDESFYAGLHEVVPRAGAPWAVLCKRWMRTATSPCGRFLGFKRDGGRSGPRHAGHPGGSGLDQL